MKYRPELKYVLENISFKVEKGKHVGIVGRTGSGKSSLFTAFYHLADVIDGQIGINGLFNMPLSKRRQSLSLIPQEEGSNRAIFVQISYDFSCDFCTIYV